MSFRVNSLTLIKLHGNTLARYERLKSSPDVNIQSSISEPVKSDRSHNTCPSSPTKNRRKSQEESEDEAYDSDYDNMEEFDRSLTREAHWNEPRNDFDATPFKPTFSNGKLLEIYLEKLWLAYMSNDFNSFVNT